MEGRALTIFPRPSPPATMRWPSSLHSRSSTVPEMAWTSVLRSLFTPQTRTLPDWRGERDAGEKS